jgi:NifU-like protein
MEQAQRRGIRMSETSANQIEQFRQNMFEHMQNPRNMGDLPDADGEGFFGSDCGDWVRFKLKLDDEGRIASARFLAYGCGTAIASSSALSEMLQGKTLAEAAAISEEDVMTFLGGLPEHKLHCNTMSYEAFRSALENCRRAVSE